MLIQGLFIREINIAATVAARAPQCLCCSWRCCCCCRSDVAAVPRMLLLLFGSRCCRCASDVAAVAGHIVTLFMAALQFVTLSMPGIIVFYTGKMVLDGDRFLNTII